MCPALRCLPSEIGSTTISFLLNIAFQDPRRKVTLAGLDAHCTHYLCFCPSMLVSYEFQDSSLLKQAKVQNRLSWDYPSTHAVRLCAWTHLCSLVESGATISTKLFIC
eukprot:gnl/MRDRNA2_/MRDRNA2_86804_c0_seq15.p1 gnl/MRDRNA2_/MRDRNA2_86804_c0~~gnl/MRDRNA2_/MRDRNA2_86804_c0_seq15.p1  ORF type:complete len:108 (+),score=1.01 gnl/MRDRNA2_/MRDRNA2_86804_c0_seq15:207-530(+)